MGVLASDIAVVMSGGSSNADPNGCLGGDPSGTPITGYLNNLFSDESTDNSQNGNTDYRCFYIFNDNSNDTFYDVNVWIASQVEGGADIKLGVPLVPDTQIVTITGGLSGGTLTLSHGSHQFTFSGSSNRTTTASNFETALSALPTCAGVTINTTSIGTEGTTAYTVIFSPGRHHPTLALVDNSLTGSGSIDVVVVKNIDGGPINQIATVIPSPATPPTGVTFATPTIDEPVSMGDLLPLDGFAVWVQRNCPAGAVGIPNDGAIIRINGKPFSSG